MLAIDWTQGFQDAWADVAAFVPKLVAAIAVFVIGWIVAKVIRNVIVRVLDKVNFDSYVDRAGIGGPLERAGYPNSADLIAKIISVGLMLLVLQLSVNAFGDSAISNAIDDMVAFIPKLVVAIVIVIITGAIANTVRDLAGNVSGFDVEGVVVDIHPTSIEVEGTDTTLFIPNSKLLETVVERRRRREEPFAGEIRN